MSEERPNPDALLAAVQREEARGHRGKLKVFFGMAAGVGKTYAMLEEARARAAEGADVLVGYAEPHIRPETEALLLGLDILPYRLAEYRGATLKEFDLDAALARKPSLVCVDELAHTNAPGSRHEKRWQDVMELLDAGVSVYATLNVQHLESVNDLVERITGVKVRETLPDAVLERADEVELVDIAPEELLERFHEGKVYRPEQAERAAKHFFTKGNLIALRELALRLTADRVDAQMQDFRRANAVRAIVPAAEHILVCVGPSPLSARLVRSARRLAAGLKVPWVAVYVETPASARLSPQDRQRVDQTLRLAEQLGAKTITLRGERVAEEVLAYARAKNVTKIVVGKPQQSRWRDLLLGSAVDDLIRHSDEIDIYVIRGPAEEAEPNPNAARPRRTRDWKGYGSAIATTAAATAGGWLLFHGFHTPDEARKPLLENVNILMLYLLGVLWVATRHGRGAAILASVLGVAAFDFCFVPPYLTLTVHDQQYVVTFAVMLLTALTISTLTHRVREQADAARERERRTQTLLALSRDLAAARSTEEIASATVRHTGEVLGERAILLLADADRRLTVRGDSAGLPVPLDPKENGVAQWVFEHDRIAGAGTATLPAVSGTYFPAKAARGPVGVLGILPTATNGSAAGIRPEQRQMVEAFASQAALALERAALAEETRAAWERVEAEFLRNTLLSGVSHDLRTPLAAITGAVTVLTESGHRLTPEARSSMLATIQSEAERMERLINNLLDMTRLESGGLVLKKEWQPLQEVVGSSLHQLDRRLAGREVIIDLPPSLPLVQFDGVAVGQVLVNLIDNALEYTPPSSPIEIAARASDGEVIVEVADRGPGLPPGTERRVFDKFFRAQPSEKQGRRGIGLGLAICRGIVEAHGGKISAANRPGGGAVFRFTLPRTGTAPVIDEAA
jgi:two-component system, OmpR family, sensor histidine kinase KdpD